jgi:hypothetical protein
MITILIITIIIIVIMLNNTSYITDTSTNYKNNNINYNYNNYHKVQVKKYLRFSLRKTDRLAPHITESICRRVGGNKHCIKRPQKALKAC